MKKLFAIISLFALVLTSCEKEEAIVIGSGLDTITATIESTTDTKATLQDGTNNNVVLWDSYDPISVFIEQGNIVHNVRYVLNDGDGSTVGVFVEADSNFEIAADATILAAVYPYDDDAEYEDGSITLLSTNSTYAYPQKVVGPMAAKANGSNLSFKNVGALVQINTSDVPDGYNNLELSSATSNLSGAYSLEFDTNGIPTATLTGNNKTITYSDNSGIGNTTIYFPVFAGTYSDLKVTAKGENKPDITLIAPKALTAVRNTIHYTTANIVVANNSNEFINAVNGSSNNITVIVGESITEMELPASSGKTITLVIQNTDSDITVRAQDTKVVSSKINLEFANRTVTDKNLTIILPDATVEASGNATFANIYSTTASNTLILGAGITATQVTVNQGNVQVNTGATVSGFVNSSAEDIVIIDNGGTIPAENTGFTERTYAEHELIKAIKDNTVNTHTLTGDVTLSEILTINRDFVLDGNGHTLTSTISGSTGRAINVGKTDCGNLDVTIKNLIIEASGQRAINLIQGSHNVTIENVTATSTNYTVNVAASAPGSTVTINQSTLSGLNTINIGANNTTMTVSDSELTTNDNSPDEGYGTITISPYNPGESSILSGSSVTVENCEFITSGTNTNGTHNISYAPGLSSVNITGENSSEISIEEVKAILPVDQNNFYGEGTLEELITKCNSGNTTNNTIILVGNVTVTQNITCNKNLTLDLNDCTMTIDTEGEWGLIFEGNTTIKNGNIVTKSRYPLLFNNETDKTEVTITDIFIVGNRNEGTNGYAGTIIMGGNAIVTINDDVNISATNYSCIIEGTSNEAMNNYAEININGGDFSLINESSNQATVLGAGFGSTINVYKGVFDGTGANFVASAYPSGGIINIENGTFKGALKEYTTNGKTVEINIEGGTFTVDPTGYLPDGYSATVNNDIWTVSAPEN